MYKHVAILGMGLIGGSLARAIRACLPDMRITAMDLDADSLRIVHEMGLADYCTLDAAQAVQGADLVILAVPVAALAEVARAIAPHLAAGAAVTDVASVKHILLEEVAPLLPKGVALVPAHPIAGSEKSGVAAGSAMLFAGKRVVLTPENPEDAAVQPISQFWRALHAEIHYMPAELHDRIYACMSHFPQLLSFAINDLYKNHQVEHDESEAFRRFMRLSGSSPALWEGIFIANKDNINSCLEHYLRVLHQISSELREGASGPQSAPDGGIVFTRLFPRIAASALISTAHMQEREIHVPLKTYAGSGFKDFTLPATEPPDEHLAHISEHALAVADAVDEFALLLQQRR